ncbi:hypothetical protein A9Q89_09190 [Gammaproteobacteria bacterium 53_120_T64]|nr:hypothetical protein A9Q89_09190 [Gammaproteobacteria bacterium 53_120_T64]
MFLLVWGNVGFRASNIQAFILRREQPMNLANVMLFFQELVNCGPGKLWRVKGLRTVAGRLATPAVVTASATRLTPCCGSMSAQWAGHKLGWCLLPVALKASSQENFT